jgi:hypothetical protein
LESIKEKIKYLKIYNKYYIYNTFELLLYLRRMVKNRGETRITTGTGGYSKYLRNLRWGNAKPIVFTGSGASGGTSGTLPDILRRFL